MKRLTFMFVALVLGLILFLLGVLAAQSDLSVLILPGQWSFTGSMTAARADATATLLRNGKVLVVGGHDLVSALASAELYDPATALFSSTGSLNVARSSHTATLLPDGRVLVAGGCTNSNCSATTRTSEVYDPLAGTWSLTGIMVDSHYFFAATLLQTGEVLVEGGCNSGNCYSVTAGAEIFDPASGTSQPRGSTTARPCCPVARFWWWVDSEAGAQQQAGALRYLVRPLIRDRKHALRAHHA
jgi:hypothetical protein